MEFWAFYRKFVLMLHKNVDLTYMMIATAVVTILAVVLAYIYTKHKLKQLAKEREEAEEKRISESQEKNTEWIEDVNNSGPLKDPVEYCGHLQSKFKETKQKLASRKIEAEMSQDQKERERQVQREQLEAIFKLMQDQSDKFGVDTMDDMADQMKLYTAA